MTEEKSSSKELLSALLVWPVGGIAGLVATIYCSTRLREGVEIIIEQGNAIGLATLGSSIRTINRYVTCILFNNLAIVLFGLGERSRLRLSICAKRSWVMCCLVKFAMGNFMTLLALGSFAACLFFLCATEAVYLLFMLLKRACDESEDATDRILALVERLVPEETSIVFDVSKEVEVFISEQVVSHGFRETCDALDRCRGGAELAFGASLCLLVGQAISCVYLMK